MTLTFVFNGPGHIVSMVDNVIVYVESNAQVLILFVKIYLLGCIHQNQISTYVYYKP